MTNIKLFINPVSGDANGEKLLRERGAWQTILTDPKKIDQQIQDHVQTNDIVIIAGGDGTINLVINALFKNNLAQQVKIALLPFGTGNDLANAYRIKYQSLTKLIRKLATFDSYQTLYAWQFNQRIFTNYISWGLDAKILSDVARWRKYNIKNKLLIKFLYAIAGFKNIFSTKQYQFEILGHSENLFALILTNISSYGGGCPIDTQQLNQQKILACIKIKNRWQFVNLILRRFFKITYRNFTKADHLQINTNSIAAELDGEVITMTEGEVRYVGDLQLFVAPEK